jgi:hypothetical protein
MVDYCGEPSHLGIPYFQMYPYYSGLEGYGLGGLKLKTQQNTHAAIQWFKKEKRRTVHSCCAFKFLTHLVIGFTFFWKNRIAIKMGWYEVNWLTGIWWSWMTFSNVTSIFSAWVAIAPWDHPITAGESPLCSAFRWSGVAWQICGFTSLPEKTHGPRCPIIYPVIYRWIISH